MNAGIFDGDLVAVHRCCEARNGQVVVARMDDEVTVKRFRSHGSYVELVAENPDFPPIIIDVSVITSYSIHYTKLYDGAMGKSAQVPLHVWLPDSMEGPTPISALIHAATMVTAGIFMVSRMSPLFELSDTALAFVIVIGSITALFMGFLGIIQNDT